MNSAVEGFASAFDAVALNAEEAANMRARSDLMQALEKHIKSAGWTQTEAAAHLGVTQPRISDLLRGKLGQFSLDHLVTMLARAGLGIEIRVRKVAVKRKEAA